MLRFLAHMLLIPLRLSPPSWTGVTLHFSPALPEAETPIENEAEGGESTDIRSKPNGNGYRPADANGSVKANGSSHTYEDGRVHGDGDVPSLRYLLHEHCPSLHSTSHFRPTPWLASGHLQTIYSARANTVLQEKVRYKRRVLLVPDGGTLSLDISPPELAQDDPTGNTETLVILHGLTGGSGETYVRNIIKPLTKPKREGGPGYRAIVVNFRACAHTPVTSPQLYSASKTSDLRCALLFITSAFPNAPLAGIGFSLGANVLSKYLGEEGDATPLRAGMVLGTPFDLSRGSMVLEKPGINRAVYSRTMAGNLARMVGRHVDVITLDKDAEKLISALYHPPPAEVCLRERNVLPNTLKYFDDTGTRFLGGHRKPYGEFPFDTADDYYHGGSALPTMTNVQRPLLAFNAIDDPIVPYELTQSVRTIMGMRGVDPPTEGVSIRLVGAGNPNIVLATTMLGGHLGWWAGWRPRRWISGPICEYLRMVLEAHEFDHLGGKRKHAYSQPGRVVTKDVNVDLLPIDAIQKWDDPLAAATAASVKVNEKPQPYGRMTPENNASANADVDVDAGDAREVEQQVGAGQQDGLTAQGAGNDRLAWLTTKVLPHAPLVHPFMHAYYHRDADGKQRQEDMLRRGRRLQLRMTLDATRLEVGFAELRKELRVAGAGDVFIGGLDIPGGVRDATVAERHQGLIQGL
ncbi:hypothetical protein K437DRAFT_290979 [Tilletiaria anomala UBC 951]|uniref:AB hydrolase-1 domain-containing protein n=1 Tax=Tilletiaria anomala (strain ATCC 24038 / CBS 436.72 / UBC 951) TaxID=1037660 RepID=A0A066VZJ6_TILAU|nr:uncharacterized protein K437DRAFT_290979 [Tilletiaria anomala UBC 951]KDN44239.1 hypothetical protein K437DRAFT_290979 [Tilletiaria anomala UBC 951]